MPPSPQPIDTPPSTTLSTPSPTELQDKHPLPPPSTSPQEMSRHLALRPIYLVVATTPCTVGTSTSATRKLGIGIHGTLPWPMIRADMNFFRKVTSTVPPTTSGSSSSSGVNPERHGIQNAVIMGRKTYASIPVKFRPLAGRTNVIVTRSSVGQVAQEVVRDLEAEERRRQGGARFVVREESGRATIVVAGDHSPSAPATVTATTASTSAASDGRRETEPKFPGVVIESSILSAVTGLSGSESSTGPRTGNIFCIGGAEIYSAVLGESEVRPRTRILQTEIRRVDGAEFECDTFYMSVRHHFPLKLRDMVESLTSDMPRFEKTCCAILDEAPEYAPLVPRFLRHNLQLRLALVFTRPRTIGCYTSDGANEIAFNGYTYNQLVDMITNFAMTIARNDRLGYHEAWHKTFWYYTYLHRYRAPIRPKLLRALWHVAVNRTSHPPQKLVRWLYETVAKYDSVAAADELLFSSPQVSKNFPRDTLFPNAATGTSHKQQVRVRRCVGTAFRRPWVQGTVSAN